mgnify:CR=1 FL=1
MGEWVNVTRLRYRIALSTPVETPGEWGSGYIIHISVRFTLSDGTETEAERSEVVFRIVLCEWYSSSVCDAARLVSYISRVVCNKNLERYFFLFILYHAM